MSSSLSLCREVELKSLCRRLGACAVGIARADAVDDDVARSFRGWLSAGRHGSMAYMARNVELRLDPRKLFPGAMSIISMAFPYRPAGGYHHPLIADYALGEDYHRVLPRRLVPVVAWLADQCGATSRVTVDSAPMLERYWAAKSGVGFIGSNQMLIVPGVGSGVFLVEIITSAVLRPDAPLSIGCGQCGRCLSACPGGALRPDGSFDARRCYSYLTIEHRGEPVFVPDASRQVYGCDVCARVCPHNSVEPPEPLEEFRPDPRLLSLDRLALSKISSGDYRRLFKMSAILRQSVTKLRQIAKFNKL